MTSTHTREHQETRIAHNDPALAPQTSLTFRVDSMIVLVGQAVWIFATCPFWWICDNFRSRDEPYLVAFRSPSVDCSSPLVPVPHQEMSQTKKPNENMVIPMIMVRNFVDRVPIAAHTPPARHYHVTRLPSGHR